MSENDPSGGHGAGSGPVDVRPVRLGWWLSSEEHDPRALVERAAAAEGAGFATAMISDHLQPWVRHQGHAAHVWTVIGAIAHATEALEVGTGVTAMVHRMHPATVAHAAATASIMLDGRFFLGVGTGERLNEQPFGERWPRAGERRDRMAEAIEVLRALWSGKNVNHREEHWNVENLRLQTRPASPPPIYVAAGGKRSAALAGEVADGLIGVTPDAKTIDIFRGSGGTGKPCVGQLTLSLADTVDAAVENALEWWPNALVPPAILTELARPSDFEAVAGAMTSSPSAGDAMRDAVVCADGADAIVAAIERYVGAGYDTVYLHQIGPDQDRLLALARSELLPHFRLG
jgi:G6PDH family F420-dependent oxidoreductase